MNEKEVANAITQKTEELNELLVQADELGLKIYVFDSGQFALKRGAHKVSITVSKVLNPTEGN